MSNPVDSCNENDLKRFALCWLLSDRVNTNWTRAAELHDPEVQIASFKTVTGRNAAKILKGTEFESKSRANGGKKRKAGGDDDIGDDATPKKKGLAVAKKKSKKVAPQAQDSEGDSDEAVKGEDDD